MKALLINPATQTVTEIQIENNLQAIYKAMDCEMVECPVEFPNGDVLYCDEEGKLNEDKVIGGFTYSKGWCDVIVNKCLVIGTNFKTGENRSCKSKPEDILNTKEWGKIKWFTKEQAKHFVDQYMSMY